MSITVPPRGSAGPPPQQPPAFSRDPRARREALGAQLPLQEGRKVAFHPPTNTSKNEGGGGGKDEEWILAVVTKCINQDKNRYGLGESVPETCTGRSSHVCGSYEVQDPEPQEDGAPGA